MRSPCVAQTGHDVALLVEALIQSAQVDLNIGVGGAQRFHALGGADQADELDVLGAPLLDHGDGVHGAAAGGQHGVQDQHVPLVDVGGQLAEIFHGLQGLLVAVQADEAHLGGGDQGQHTVQHAHAGPQDGYQGQFAAGQDLGLGHGDGGLDLDLLQGQIPGGLVAQQGGDLAHQVTELLGTGLLVAQQADLVLQQGVLNDHGVHNYTLL